MIQYTIQDVCTITGGTFLQHAGNPVIQHLIYDSRRIQFAEASLFFALKTIGNDGHLYLQQAYKNGVRNFVVDHSLTENLEGSNIILVPHVLQALQALAAHHRQLFQIPIVGITGSNGKTIVKEWLFQLLQQQYHIARSPKSFNSQIGVPLSVWTLNSQHTLGIFEAGISQPGEMQQLQSIIKPTIGILTNIGEAHNEGFDSMEEKKTEKLKLFANAAVVIAPEEEVWNTTLPHTFTWGTSPAATVQVKSTNTVNKGTSISLQYNSTNVTVWIPFTDVASIHNAITCCCILFYLQVDVAALQPTFSKLHAVDMRLHLMQGINNCTIINDSYSADLTSLQIALSFVQQQNMAGSRTIILSDFIESGQHNQALYRQIAALLLQYNIQKVLAVGEHITQHLPPFLSTKVTLLTFTSTDELLLQLRPSLFREELILIKGARRFGFERIVPLLQYQVHQTQLQINLNALAHNLKQYTSLLKNNTKIMAMVKAFAYGSGSAEVASVLQYHNVAYLGVAYADEGVTLRKAGITLPIMVLNVDESAFAALTDYNLQPVIYSDALLQRFQQFISAQGLQLWPVHIEVETGMNRLGFTVNHIDALGATLAASSLLKVESVFSHLAASEDATQDNFTAAQGQLFQKAILHLQQHLSYPFIKHIANSAAIIRHPQLIMDMVRIGIGLYGVEIETKQLALQPVASLQATIAQIKHLDAGDTVSYNRRGLVQKEATIATVRIGYADGYSRRLGHGIGKMWVGGRLAPVIGTVCMDMTMIDVTGIPGVAEGDAVVVFGDAVPVQQVAQWAGTIPYEIMTGISQRVKRVYYQE